MSVQFHVDTQAIQAASSDVHRISAAIETEVAAMMSRLTTLDQAWRGTAAAGFQQCITQWHGTAGQVRLALNEIHIALARAGEQYASVEAANTSMFRAG